MKINTQSIVCCIEIEINKNIDKIDLDELKKIKVLNINKLEYGGDLLEVDYNDLIYFENLVELTIMNCMINELCMKNILKLKNLKKISFINCDFIDNCEEFFELIGIDCLNVTNCIGIGNVCFKDLKELMIKNISNDINVEKVDKLQLLNIGNNKINIENINELIIKEADKNKINNLNGNTKKITILDDTNEVVEVLKYD